MCAIKFDMLSRGLGIIKVGKAGVDFDKKN